MSATRLAVVIADLQIGGLQSMAIGLAASLERSEFEPVVYTFDAGGPLEADLDRHGMEHVHLPRGEGVRPGHARTLARRFGADGVGLVHCHNMTALFHGARAGRRAGIPVLYTEHDRDMPAPWRHRLLNRWLARRVGCTVAVSERLAGALIRWDGFPRARTRALVNGVPDPRAAFAGSRGAARQELGWGSEPTVLAVGSLSPVKGHDRLLAAFGLVLATLPQARLVLAGDGPLREVIGRQAAQLGAGRVALLGQRRDVERLLAACDVLALSSHNEGMPLSLIEAHGAGRPSVAFDVGGVPEVITDGLSGRIVPDGDVEGLAEALLAYLQDPQKAGRSGEAARRRFEERFTHESMVATYVDLYRRLMAGKLA